MPFIIPERSVQFPKMSKKLFFTQFSYIYLYIAIYIYIHIYWFIFLLVLFSFWCLKSVVNIYPVKNWTIQFSPIVITFINKRNSVSFKIVTEKEKLFALLSQLKWKNFYIHFKRIIRKGVRRRRSRLERSLAIKLTMNLNLLDTSSFFFFFSFLPFSFFILFYTFHFLFFFFLFSLIYEMVIYIEWANTWASTIWNYETGG